MNGMECNIDFKCKHLGIYESEDHRVKPLYSCNLLRIPFVLNDDLSITCEINQEKPGFYVNPCEFKE